MTALQDLTISIPAGQAVAITGTSGSGKSTLLHIVGAMDAPDTGTVRVADTDVTALHRKDLPAYRRRIGFVFQRFHLLPALTVLDNVLAPLLPHHTDYDKTAAATELLRAVGLGDRAHDMPFHLSGGQQQRVALARALINRPGLLLADEPTGNLDTATGKEILDLLDALRTQYSFTALIATHDQNVAARCHRIIALQDGQLTTDERSKDGP